MIQTKCPILSGIAVLLCLIGTSGEIFRALLTEQGDKRCLDESENFTTPAKIRWKKRRNDTRYPAFRILRLREELKVEAKSAGSNASYPEDSSSSSENSYPPPRLAGNFLCVF